MGISCHMLRLRSKYGWSSRLQKPYWNVWSRIRSRCSLLPLTFLPKTWAWVESLYPAWHVPSGQLICFRSSLRNHASTHPGEQGDIFLSLVSNSFLQIWIFLTSATGGVSTILFALIVFFFLADFPGTAKFLLQDTQTLAVECLQTHDTTAKHKV